MKAVGLLQLMLKMWPNTRKIPANINRGWSISSHCLRYLGEMKYTVKPKVLNLHVLGSNQHPISSFHCS